MNKEDLLNNMPCFFKCENDGITAERYYINENIVIFIYTNEVIEILSPYKFNNRFTDIKKKLVEISEDEFTDALNQVLQHIPIKSIKTNLSISELSNEDKALKLIDIANNSKDKITEALIPQIKKLFGDK